MRRIGVGSPSHRDPSGRPGAPDTCAGYLKTLAEMEAAMKAAGATQPPTDPNDAKTIAYCRANPRAALADAMTQALQ